MRYLFLLLLFQPYFASGQDSQAQRFLRFLNEYNADSLAPMLSDDFTLERTFVRSSHDKSRFLGEYIKVSKAYNATFVVVGPIANDNGPQLLVQDKSDYLEYLGITAPFWTISFAVKNGKIEKVVIDTTASSKKYFEELPVKSKKFEDWLDKVYPGEANEKIYVIPGLLIRRVKEFAGLEDSH